MSHSLFKVKSATFVLACLSFMKWLGGTYFFSEKPCLFSSINQTWDEFVGFKVR